MTRPVLEAALAGGPLPDLAAVSTEVLEAELRELARQHGAAAAPLLRRLADGAADKSVRKSARRALYRLAQAGMAPAAAGTRPRTGPLLRLRPSSSGWLPRIRGSPMCDEPGIVVEAIAADWIRFGLEGDRARLVDLYAGDAIFFGSLPNMYTGRSGVAEYFEVAPLTALKTVRFDWQAISFVTPSVINAGGLAYFGMEQEGEPISWRFGISWMLVKSEGRWLIAAHHASRRELLPA